VLHVCDSHQTLQYVLTFIGTALHVRLFAISSAVVSAKQWMVLDASTWMAYCTCVVEYWAAPVLVLCGPSKWREPFS